MDNSVISLNTFRYRFPGMSCQLEHGRPENNTGEIRVSMERLRHNMSGKLTTYVICCLSTT